MEFEIGEIIAVSERKVRVRTGCIEFCGNCSNKNCSTSKNSKSREFYVYTTEQYQLGEFVQIEVKPLFNILSAVSIYLIPIIMLFVGLIVFSLLEPLNKNFDNEIIMILGAALGLMFGFIISVLFNKKILSSKSLQPEIVGRVVR